MRILRFSILVLFCITFTTDSLLGGDTPCVATSLDPSTTVFNTFSNAGNSDSGVDTPPYGGYNGADMWFLFTMPSTGLVNLIIEGGSMTNPSIAIYEGPCTNPKLLYNILDNNCNTDLNPSVLLSNLLPGTDYYIRIWAENGSGDGSFDIYLSETVNTSPEFLLHSDASQLGDCILLTPEANGQQGCAWFEFPIDFTEPFTHTMTANFGDKDASGADGICLIYQANGPDYCGGSGGGIGAEGMPNSAIFEFDTWQNPNKLDPIQDHCAFNINGDMDHTNSINGPVILPNIEDGADHTITFIWDGSSNYELYFDGVLVLSGSFDFINNIFGGSNTAWWGYTSSTGAANNMQSICPSFEEYQLGTQEYIEIEICEGETYNGYSETGFYIDYTGGIGSCNHQINTNLIVHPIPDPVYLEASICEGFAYQLGNNFYFETGEYPVYLQSLLGCDSLVILNLLVIEADVEIITDFDTINCITESIELISQITSNIPDSDINFIWQLGNQTNTDSTWIIDQEGNYSLDMTLEYLGTTCTYSTNKDIYLDTISPVVIGLEDVIIDCDTASNINILSAEQSIPLGEVSFSWTYNDAVVGDLPIQNINGEGTYFVEIYNYKNGCTDIDSAKVSLSDNRPKVSITPDTLDCLKDNLSIQIEQDTQLVTYQWLYNDTLFSRDKNPIINQGGIYELIVTNTQDCQTRAIVNIEADTIKPSISLVDTIIPCNAHSILLDQYSIINEYKYEWEGSNLTIDNMLYPTVSDQGFYTLSITNLLNHCVTFDTLFVEKLGNSPIINVDDGILDCKNEIFSPELQYDQVNVTTNWILNGSTISSDQDIEIGIVGVYYIEALSPNGCLSIDSISVTEDKVSPTITFDLPDTIDCNTKTIILTANIEKADNLTWTGPQQLVQDISKQTINQPGTYYIQAKNTANGCTSMDSIEVYSKVVVPIYSIGDDTLDCSYPAKQLPFSINSDFDSLQWSGPNQFKSKMIDPEVDQMGLYLLHIDVPGNCDIDTSLFLAGDFAPPLAIIESEDITCTDTVSNVTLSFDNNVDFWVWTTPSYMIANEANFKVTEAGIHLLTVVGKNGCQAVDTITIAEFLDNPIATIDKSNDIDCNLTDVELTSSSQDTSLIYTWQTPLGYTILNPNFTSMESGVFTLKVENQYGCTQEYILEVFSNIETPEVQLDNGVLDCKDQETFIEATINTGDNIEYQWNGPSGYTATELKALVTTPGYYTFKAINDFGCESIDSVLIIQNIEYSSIKLLTPDTLIIDSDEIDGGFEIEIDTDLDYSLLWIPSNGLSCDDCTNPQILEDYNDTYLVILTNEFGCISELSTFIIEKEKPVDIHIPNIISVDGNSINDGFTFYGNADKIKHIESLMIFDRWGNKIFHEEYLPINSPEKGWKGYFNGQKVQEGVYIYYGSVTLLNGQVKVYKGDVTVIR